ncbi:hypothetical protein DTL42_04410 [Bremerella cremea]|uniref:DUF4352 domain-containing protein n=1 Tax=Bremerella cremea TaxID=1031537 RepID=A0A368KXJ7_9BACT|nr:MJ0042-type zinc finger domain-containing protein [Bremerella cremea]RCS54395.1 hypothetical protein DTL42_04410 [Bremerella cremea]
MHLKCPHCSTVLNVTSPAGTQVQCPTCQGVFVVPQAAPAVGPVITPKQSGSRANAKGKAKAAESDNTDPDAENAEAEKGEIPWKTIIKTGYIVFFSLLSAAGLFVVYLYVTADRGDSEEVVVDEADFNRGNQIQERITQAETGEQYIKWIPAKNSATMEGFRVKVNHVDWGEVRGRDERGEIVTSGRPYINVYLELSNRSDKTFQFKSWYGNVFTSPSGALRTAQISDEEKRTYDPIMFDDLSDLKWWTPKKTFEPLEEGTDVIVFDVPEDFDPNAIENLYLDLPGEAVTRDGASQPMSGSYRFKIPKSMIQGISNG